MGGVADPKSRYTIRYTGYRIRKIHPDMCYHLKFGSSVIKGVRINRKELPKIGER